MSASAKLRALDAFDWAVTVHVSDISEWSKNANLISAFRTALPLIADCIEGLERLDLYRNQYEAAMMELGWTFGDVLAFTEAHRRLTALDKHLEGGDE